METVGGRLNVASMEATGNGKTRAMVAQKCQSAAAVLLVVTEHAERCPLFLLSAVITLNLFIVFSPAQYR